jgi:23S rRNA (guanosine2251-2'-O)-methyltransferase
MKIIFGRKPVLESLKSDANMEKLFIVFGAKGEIINEIKKTAKKNRVNISEASQSKLNDISKGKNHQGVMAYIRDNQKYSLHEIINESHKSTLPFLLLLDSIQDPGNLGAILRTAECAGVDGIIMTTHKSATITESVEKTSAGAITHLKICEVNNLNNTIKELKKNNYWIFGSSLTARSKSYQELDYKMPLALVLGNEEKGIRKLVADNCDFLASIPMKGKLQSLNVSVAAGVLLFEIIRQRGL